MAALFKRSYTPPRQYLPPKKWYEALCSRGNELVQDFKTDSITTIDALLVELCGGDIVAKEMLRHLLFWWPHSVRNDGAVWRTAAQWKAECGLTSSQVYNKKRRLRLEKIGVIVENTKANGSPTMHFLLDANKFTAAIAKAIKWSIISLKAKLWSLFVKPVSVLPKPVSSQMQKPLTDSTTNKTTKTYNRESVDALSSPDGFTLLKNLMLLSPNESKRYSHLLKIETIQACIDSLESAEIKTSHAAYLRASLRKQVEEQAAAKKKTMQNPFANLSFADFAE